MPGTQDPADQVKFLVSCIGHTNNGRPDFAAVAQELGIVSKAAAQKRYERMLKANGVTANKAKGNDYTPPTPETTPVKRRMAAPRTSVSAKKVKGKNVKKEESDDDESKEDVKKKEDTESELSDPPPSE